MIDFPVVSQEEAENATIMVCCRVGEPSHFTDNVFGTCFDCKYPIFFRPHAPKRPPKVCIECAADRVRGGQA